MLKGLVLYSQIKSGTVIGINLMTNYYISYYYVKLNNNNLFQGEEKLEPHDIGVWVLPRLVQWQQTRSLTRKPPCSWHSYESGTPPAVSKPAMDSIIYKEKTHLNHIKKNSEFYCDNLKD